MILKDWSDFVIIDWESSGISNINKDYSKIILHLICQKRDQGQLISKIINEIETMDSYIQELFDYYLIKSALMWINHRAFGEKAKSIVDFCHKIQNGAINESRIKDYLQATY